MFKKVGFRSTEILLHSSTHRPDRAPLRSPPPLFEAPFEAFKLRNLWSQPFLSSLPPWEKHFQRHLFEGLRWEWGSPGVSGGLHGVSPGGGGKIHFHPKPLHANDLFIQNFFIQSRAQKHFIQKQFHPKTVSSHDRSIQTHSHPNTLSSKIVGTKLCAGLGVVRVFPFNVEKHGSAPKSGFTF